MDTVAMQAKYEQTVRQQQADIQKEDFSDMVAEHSAKAAKVSHSCFVQQSYILSKCHDFTIQFFKIHVCLW